MVVCEMEAQLQYGAHCMHIFFGTCGADLYARSVPINKISALELQSEACQERALLVG